MNSPAVLNDIALTKQLPDGTIEWVTLQAVGQKEPASAGVSYTLIDRSRSYEAPQSLRLERRGEDLVVDSEGSELLVITGFFAAVGTSFFPEPDIASGAGPFSGPAITPDTETVRDSSGGPLIVWGGESDANDQRAEQEAASLVEESGVSPWVWVGAGLGLLGIAAAAGGGGGGGGDDTLTPTPGPTPPEPSDTTPPQITSSETAAAIDENSSAGQAVYSAVATDAAAVTWSLTGTDAALFSINASTGVVTLVENPDFETQPSYEFTVVATDAEGNQSQQSVALAVNDLNDAAPRITSGAIAATLEENSGSNQAVYTATAEGSVTWSLGTGGNAAQLSINANNGVVTLSTNPDHETQSSFSFTVIATDADGNRSEQPVNLTITDLDEVAPTITSGAATQAITENAGAGQLVYTATSTDTGDIGSGPISFSLAQVGDATAFTIDSVSGAVTLVENPNFETQSRFDFTVIATDGAGNSSQQSVSLIVSDVDDTAPSITSGAIANTIDENSGADQAIYTAAAEGLVTWSLDAGVNSADLSIDASSGVVTLATDPDNETQADYTFTVIATDAVGNSSQQIVSLAVNNLDEVGPSITSSATANAINENSGAGQLVYIATSTDNGDVSTGTTQYSLAPGADAAAFSINATSGAVTLIGNPDFETQSSYMFTVIATDAAGNSTQQAVSLAVSDVDENAPQITSGSTAVPIDENIGVDQTIFTATALDAATWSLAPGGDASVLSIDANSGVVTLDIDPDHETQPSYAFTVIATNAAGNSSQQTVSLAVNDLDEVAPTITSQATANAINENSGAGQVVYIATSTDTGDISNGPTQYTLAGPDAAAFNINVTSGAVTLIGNPDFETQASYSFTVIATDAAGNSTQQAVSLDVNNLDDNAPEVTSGATATPIDENIGVDQVIYGATASEGVTWSLGSGGDAGAFSINTNTGDVTFNINPDHETQASYSFTVIATDEADNASEQTVSLAINDLDEVAPTITSGDTAGPIDEGSGSNQLVYNANSTDTGDISTGSTIYSLTDDGDSNAFTINPNNGVVRLIANPDFELQSSFTFTVEATDAAGNNSEQTVTLAVNDVDETGPEIDSGATAEPIDENSGINQIIYTATSSESDLTWSLAAGGDAGDFMIDESTGQVTFNINPDHETQASYTFTVIATDEADNASEQTVSLAINDLDEVAPTITSPAIADAIDENSGPLQLVYTATSTDTGDISTGSTEYSLAGPDADAFTISATSGAVTLIANPDFEVQPSYSFTVVATDEAGNFSEQAVTLAVDDVAESGPDITSGATAAAIDENSGMNQVIYNAQAGEIVTWSLAPGADSALSINPNTGAVTLAVNPDHETLPSYAFTVVATNSATTPISSQQAVTLDINDLDEIAPTITSGATADTIDEDSGANQVVYTATSTDTDDISTGSTQYSLAGPDADEFSIDATSGAVTLIDNPDFELQSSFTFTVEATDAAGNSSQQEVTLDINELDEGQPSVVSVELTDAIGAADNVLNAGDTIRVTVTLDSPVTVDDTDGTPQISLAIGATTVVADFVTGGDPEELLFEYVIQAGDNDADGISIPTNALSANGGSITDALDNAADLDHAEVADNDEFIVDTIAPTLDSSSPTDDAIDVLIGADIVLTFAEDVTAASGSITISDGTDTRIIDVADATQVDVNGAVVTINPTTDLDPNSTYNVQIDADAFVDTAGNGFAGIDNETDLNFDTEIAIAPSATDSTTVVFDLPEGDLASLSGRQFGVATSDDINILAASQSTLSGVQRFSGADDLGSDSRITLVSDSAEVEVYWETDADTAALFEGSSFERTTEVDNDSPGLFENSSDLELFGNQNADLDQLNLTDLPIGILTSQGLV